MCVCLCVCLYGGGEVLETKLFFWRGGGGGGGGQGQQLKEVWPKK